MMVFRASKAYGYPSVVPAIFKGRPALTKFTNKKSTTPSYIVLVQISTACGVTPFITSFRTILKELKQFHEPGHDTRLTELYIEWTDDNAAGDYTRSAISGYEAERETEIFRHEIGIGINPRLYGSKKTEDINMSLEAMAARVWKDHFRAEYRHFKKKPSVRILPAAAP